MERSDHDLLIAVNQGDKRALEALLLRYQDRIYGFGLKFCRNTEDAEDVLQETLLAAARSVHDFREQSSLSTWLYSIARSFCIKQRRRSKFAPEQADSLDAPGKSPTDALQTSALSPDQALANKELEQLLDRAIRSLEPEYREALVLRDVQGLKTAEVAQVLQLTPAAVKSRLHRARLRVRELVSPALGIGTPSVANSCPDVLALYSQYVEDEISPELCAQMQHHLAECEFCRGSCDSLKQTLALCSAAQVTRVPERVQESVRQALREFLTGTALPAS